MTDKIEEMVFTWLPPNTQIDVTNFSKTREAICNTKITLFKINNQRSVSHANIINKKNWDPNQDKWLCDDALITHQLCTYEMVN